MKVLSETQSRSISVDVTDDETDTDLDTATYYDEEHEASSTMQELLLSREKFDTFELLPICTVALVGMIFGLCLNKGRIFEPNVIVQQMTFARFIMLKLFLSAAGTSAIMLSICAYVYNEHFLFARSKYRNNFGLLRVMFGGFMLGVGITIAGSCPGMVLVQCGAGVPYSYITLFGLLFGAFLCVLMKPLIGGYVYDTKPFLTLFNYTFIDEYFVENVYLNYRLISAMFGTFCWIIVIIFECLWPWKSELTIANAANCNFLTCSAWPPQVSGLIIGILQVPLLSVLGNAIGCSSSYICVMSQWVRYCNKRLHEIFIIHLESELNKWWQVLFILFIVFGSWIAVCLTQPQSLNVVKYPYDNIEGTNELRAFIGGMLLIFGSRIAGGCSSGHGLSGFALLAIDSMFVILSMFVGGILTAFIIQ